MGQQAEGGVVLPEQQTPLRAGGEHPVGLVGALRHEVVDENADVRFCPVKDERFDATDKRDRIDSGDEPLCGGFLISGRAIDLAGKEGAGKALGLQRGPQVPRIVEVILYGVGPGAEDGVL